MASEFISFPDLSFHLMQATYEKRRAGFSAGIQKPFYLGTPQFLYSYLNIDASIKKNLDHNFSWTDEIYPKSFL